MARACPEKSAKDVLSRLEPLWVNSIRSPNPILQIHISCHCHILIKLSKAPSIYLSSVLPTEPVKRAVSGARWQQGVKGFLWIQKISRARYVIASSPRRRTIRESTFLAFFPSTGRSHAVRSAGTDASFQTFHSSQEHSRPLACAFDPPPPPSNDHTINDRSG